MDFFNDVWNVLTNSGNLEQWIGQHGSHIYLWLALIIFCETGLVVLPF